MDEEKTDIFSNYTLTKELGNPKKQKFGRVFEGFQNESKKRVILKLLEKTSNNSLEQELLFNEASFSFEQQGLPKIVEFTTREDYCYLIKEMQQGIPLSTFWETIPKKRRIAVYKEMMTNVHQLLCTLHQGNIIHADLKPDNILIDDSNDQIKVSLIDFGLAIRKNQHNTRKMVFSLAYAAPELILNKLDLVNPSTDYFSLGMISYKLWTGRLPFSHPNPSILTNLQLVHPIERPSEMPKSVWNLIGQWLLKPQFPTAPNRMKEDDVNAIIQSAQVKRMSEFGLVETKISKITSRKWNWF